MAWCAYCKEETEIYIGGDVPICSECFDAQEAIRNQPAPGPSASPFRTIPVLLPS